MNIHQPLAGCTITGSLRNSIPDFSAVASSLRYQSRALGAMIQSTEDNDDSATASLSFEFKTPHTKPVICKITKWDKSAKQTAVTENIIQAACGLMSVHGRVSGKPQSLGLDYVSTLTATLALQGGAATALGQLRGLSATSNHVSMAAAALLSMGQYIAGATATESPETLFPGSISHPAAPPFISSDGIIFELETLNVEPWQQFWAQIGIHPTLAGNGWTAFLLRYAKAIAPIPDALISALSKHTFRQISEIAINTGMSICSIRTIDERILDKHFAQEWRQGPWAFQAGPGLSSPAFPKQGRHTLPLSGLTVIESCRRIQGPLAGHLLTFLGARVIRIEPPGGDPLRGMPPMADGCSARFDALNQGKIIREIDIKSSAGKAEIKNIVRTADVFLHNWAPGKAAQLGLDYSDLTDLNPALVYGYAAGWSTHEKTPAALHATPGTDFMAQAYSGVAKKIAHSSGTNGGSLFTVLDILGGVVAAQGITIALLSRHLNNMGVRVTSSLMSSATLLCNDDFQDPKQLPDTRSSSKPVINNIYPTRHGKIAIECRDYPTTTRLIQALDIAIDTEEIDFQQSLTKYLFSKTADEWVTIFEQAGIPAAVVIEDLTELQTQARLKSHFNPGSYTRVKSPWSFK
ncbi:Crotonobetainyl-CoA:carnitine CoA-transferase CaiB [Nitrosomonas cryotolerans]|uniref:Crotonobetainyl-CoA:carnitine CoA-transferase CaiB n=1 Tax=Nitrosomonas cryotolerans ATCC 49181 TaxID=1131553 RepID=A0A1N6IWU2_9PROT|nr:CoA transferase [Nitrosomonas cryotolerans]SFP85687.1 Crotonobetainyl-CoA:carnitine CoA-transferase CaiB [Nitrosomonas cryotolerans]SIO36510.1 Crotonobetainyl-CoA:carnitine CoA-transferase CaiB [Nitrosomonas cryotolerans ATCC 49181]